MLRQLTNSNFSIFAEMVAAPARPIEYCPAAMERLMVYLSPYVECVKGVRFKYHARNKIELINFQTREEQEAYQNAWEDYLKACALIEEREGEGGGGKFMILVQFLKFRQAAELIRAPYLARRLYDIAYKKQRNALCGLGFKETIAKITSHLVTDYHVPREDISLIWGGITSKKKKKTLDKEQMDRMKELFSLEDLSMLKELGIESDDDDITKRAEQSELEQGLKDRNRLLNLGAQSKKDRQINIDRFQQDKSKFCLFTFKSGGVGLSLHQETPTNRVRESLFSPTYSAIEMVQGLGRAARLTSCSDTEQTIVFYANTIEVRVSVTCSQKLKCLSKAVQKRESWESVIFGVTKDGLDSAQDNDVMDDGEEESDGLLSGGSIVDEEDDDDSDDNSLIKV